MKLFPARKDSIILSAIDIIDELGIQGLSTKEIASRQGIAESALYRHFSSKDDILKAILEYFSQYDDAVVSTIESGDRSCKEAILFLVEAYAGYYESYPAITAIIETYSAFLRNSYTEALGKAIYVQRREYLIKLIQAGQARGEIMEYFSDEELADIITGYFEAVIMKWRRQNYHFLLKDTVVTTLKKILTEFTVVAEACR